MGEIRDEHLNKDIRIKEIVLSKIIHGNPEKSILKNLDLTLHAKVSCVETY